VFVQDNKTRFVLWSRLDELAKKKRVVIYILLLKLHDPSHLNIHHLSHWLLLVCACFSFSLCAFRSYFLFSYFYFDRYKKKKNGTSYTLTLTTSRCLVSFVPFSTWLGFALRTFNLFAPSLHSSLCIRVYIFICVYIYVCVCVCVCVRFVLYMSAIDSLQTYTCMRAYMRTYNRKDDDDGKRDTPRRWVEEQQRQQHQRENHLRKKNQICIFFWYTKWLLCCLFDIKLLGAKYVLTFRSVPMTTMMTSRRVAFQCSYGDMIFFSLVLLFLLSYLSFIVRPVAIVFFLLRLLLFIMPQVTTTSIGFFAQYI